MAQFTLQKSTIVRIQQQALRTGFAATERLATPFGAAAAERLWFTIPPPPPLRPVPEGGTDFVVPSQGGQVHGVEWGEGPVVYLVHGWGGHHTQLASLVSPLVQTGHRVVAFDAPSHGRSGPGPSGPRRSTVVEFGRALDDVACRYGPARAVVGHSLGAMATLLAMEHGWLGSERLAFVAPMLSVRSAIDVFSSAVGIGPRVRDRLGERIAARVSLPLDAFETGGLPLPAIPTLVVHDRGDRQTPYAVSEQVVATHPAARLVSTTGLGHHRLLREPEVVSAVTQHLTAVDPEVERVGLAS